ncbi:MAG TPA: MG2 domain-containing protein, partial [Planctomycetota bacterium]|nr:MG2 domain-containing protein [Planctomycetota bacterium]
MKRAIGLLSILVAASAFAMGAPPAPQDPPQEDALWSQIHEDLNNNRRNEAAPKLESFLERFPNSVRAPEALFHLASTYEQRNRKKSVEKYLELVQKHPKHELAPQALLNAAQSLRQLGKKDEAKAALRRLFKEYPGSNASQSGLWQFWSLDNKNFQFSVNRTFAEDQPVSVSAHFRNVDKVDYSLFKLDTSAVLKRIESGAVFANVQELIGTVPATGREKLKEWSDQPKYDANRWSSTEVKVDVPGPGLYIFRAVHDEIPVEVGLVVARYGLVVKSSPNRTIVFAVDRRTGRALPKMSLRFSEGDKKTQGTTGEDGLFTLDRAFTGTVAGLMDGEIALTNVWSHGSGDEMKSYLFTDRPIYRPNQTVHFKAIHRILKTGGEFENVSGKTTKVEIRDPRGNVLYQKDLATNASGAVDGELRLGDEPPLGHYYIMSSLGGYGQFRVEEYRKPEYEVKAKFEGGARIQGDELKVEVSVDYYFGSPVVDSEISYEIRRRPHYKFPWRCFYAEWDWYDDGDEDDDDDEAPVRRGRGWRHGWAPEEVVTKGVGKTDKRGKFRMACSTAKSDKDHVYSIVARVVDRSRREVQGRAEVKVARSNLELHIAASKHLYSPGDTVIVRAKLADLDGKPAADREVALSAATSTWRRRGDQGDYEHSEFFAGTTRTDAQGVSEFSFPADKEGYIRFKCVAKDDRGTEISEERWVWICGASWAGNFQNLTGLDVVPDKEIYRPGETAKILITSQAKGVHVLFTVEGDGIFRHEILKVKDHSIVVDVAIDGKRHTPNVFFSAVTMSGNEFLASTKSVNVPPADRLLTVKIRTDKEKYRPREKAQVTIEVTDAAGKPVITDLSLSLVDESIYALQRELAPDIRKFFFAKRWNRTTVSSSMHYYDYGRAGEAAPAPSSAAPGDRKLGFAAKESARGRSESKDDAGMAETEVRGNFPDTWHWSPSAATDASGRFTFATEVPDSLTTWRATARAATADTRVGQAKLEFVARKEIIVRLATPRFFTQKDACVVSGVVHNYRDDVDEVLVSLEAEGVEVEGPREVKVKLGKGEDKRVDWKLKAATAGSAKLLARARSPKESDAMQLVIPILPHGSLEAVTKAGTAEGAVREKLVLPESAIREASELTISVAPSVASQVAGALEFLAGYPYGCVEQTMSRFLPSVVAARAMQQMGVKNDKLQKELPDMVLAGLQRLYNFQHYDGGWGWWEGDQSHPYMTAYVVYGLAKAKEADHAVDAGVLQRGIQCLKNFAAKRDSGARRHTDHLPNDELAYILFALWEAGGHDKEALEALLSDRGSLSDYGLALLALTLAREKRDKEAAVVLANLDESAKQGEAYCYWEGHRQRWHWMSHSIETTAYVLRAYGKVAPKDAKIHKIVRWLAANRHGNRWHSTKDT